MLAGNPYKRSFDGSDMAKAIGVNCLGGSREPTRQPDFPPNNCPNGMRLEVMFPSCWDGKNVDSKNHQSHVAYPVGVREPNGVHLRRRLFWLTLHCRVRPDPAQADSPSESKRSSTRSCGAWIRGRIVGRRRRIHRSRSSCRRATRPVILFMGCVHGRFRRGLLCERKLTTR